MLPSLAYYLLLVIVAPVITGHPKESDTRLLVSSNLSQLSYEQIHEFAIKDQVKFHEPALKSLQTRRTKSLDGVFEVCFDTKNEGFTGKWHSKPLVRSCASDRLFQLPVPSAFNEITSLAWIRDFVGWIWYQKHVFIVNTDEIDNWQWALHFDNANYLALVWVQPMAIENNYLDANITVDYEAIFLGSHVGGYLPFTLDLAPALKGPSLTGKFRLTVAISNQLTRDTIPSGKMVDLSEEVGRKFEIFKPDFDFFHFSGLMGSIHLVQIPRPLHFANIERLPEADYKLAFNVCISESQSEPNSQADPIQSKISVEIELYWMDSGHLLASTEFHLNKLSGCHQLVLVPQDDDDTLKPWLPVAGQVNHRTSLYSSVFKLKLLNILDGGSVQLDVHELQNLASTRRRQESLLTSHSNILQGFGMHHEQLFQGRAMTLSAILKDIYLLKQMGATLIRTSHYPYSSGYLAACDEHGIQVIAEAPAVGLSSFSELKLELHKQLLLEMMQRDHEHPSIVMWSLANEPQSQLPGAREYFSSLLEFARTELHRYTSDRALTAAIAQSPDADQVAQLLDVVMVNKYVAWYEATGVLEAIGGHSLSGWLCAWARRLAGKPLILSEFGADTLSGQHSWYAEGDLFSEEFQSRLLIEHERVLDSLMESKTDLCDQSSSVNISRVISTNKSHLNLIGSMIWNFADFSTHPSLLRPGGNRKGVFNRQREPKVAAEKVREVYLRRLKANNMGAAKEEL